MSGRARCPDCADGLFEGNGKCARCDGTGVNPHLNSAEPKCPHCRGTGACPTCNGTGYTDGDDTGGLITLDLE